MKGYRTKRIVLPGGRVIEIVYFSDSMDGEAGSAEGLGAAEALAAVEEIAAGASPEAGHDDAAELHVCPACDSDLVYPVAWEERDDDAWRIERRCPNCEWRHVGDFDQDVVETFDDVLNDGTEELLLALREHTRSNMETDVERMISAIHADAILPMDF